ncbi:MAG: GlxA family transcriptional regulator [Candidatus Polarisedimenticolia bacterium]
MFSRPVPSDRRLIVLVLPHVHLLDLSGPVQAFHEAGGLGAPYRIVHCGVEASARSAQGLVLGSLERLPTVTAQDLVLVPGVDSTTLDRLDHVPSEWLRSAHRAGARVASICSGAFILAHAGLLDGRACTTHWKVASRLQEKHPSARVARNRLFVVDDRIITSAGVASGIDMALAFLEKEHGALLAARVAREMVVYIRRNGDRDQTSIYLDYRSHLDEGIHRVQDWLAAHPQTAPTLETLAGVAAMSARNLTRGFRQATGISIKGFTTRMRLQIAGDLLQDPGYSVERVAASCGFKDARQLRRLWKSQFGTSPRDWRRNSSGRSACS